MECGIVTKESQIPTRLIGLYKKAGKMEVKLENENGLALWIGPNDLVQIPMDKIERDQCRKALLDALNLLDQTIVKLSTFSTAAEMDQCVKQSPPHLSDCLAVYDSSHPSARQECNPKPKLQLVSVDPPSSDCCGHGLSSSPLQM